ncbi:hypothetical protein BAJUN_03320 [Bajunvirus bajun]|uniref:Uncharacterized protein n=1 Tax=Brevundimonas phage vB_BgoS-Bajun TaxID=2948594 RepID=A0A9E7N560_9CAUD|nr:hypothetical protein BAJUN_03320 [Brevundimonas phage vB_BgoS-Bajun]
MVRHFLGDLATGAVALVAATHEGDAVVQFRPHGARGRHLGEGDPAGLVARQAHGLVAGAGEQRLFLDPVGGQQRAVADVRGFVEVVFALVGEDSPAVRVLDGSAFVLLAGDLHLDRLHGLLDGDQGRLQLGLQQAHGVVFGDGAQAGVGDDPQDLVDLLLGGARRQVFDRLLIGLAGVVLVLDLLGDLGVRGVVAVEDGVVGLVVQNLAGEPAVRDHLADHVEIGLRLAGLVQASDREPVRRAVAGVDRHAGAVVRVAGVRVLFVEGAFDLPAGAGLIAHLVGAVVFQRLDDLEAVGALHRPAAQVATFVGLRLRRALGQLGDLGLERVLQNQRGPVEQRAAEDGGVEGPALGVTGEVEQARGVQAGLVERHAQVERERGGDLAPLLHRFGLRAGLLGDDERLGERKHDPVLRHGPVLDDRHDAPVLVLIALVGGGGDDLGVPLLGLQQEPVQHLFLFEVVAVGFLLGPLRQAVALELGGRLEVGVGRIADRHAAQLLQGGVDLGGGRADVDVEPDGVERLDGRLQPAAGDHVAQDVGGAVLVADLVPRQLRHEGADRQGRGLPLLRLLVGAQGDDHLLRQHGVRLEEGRDDLGVAIGVQRGLGRGRDVFVPRRALFAPSDGLRFSIYTDHLRQGVEGLIVEVDQLPAGGARERHGLIQRLHPETARQPSDGDLGHGLFEGPGRQHDPVLVEDGGRLQAEGKIVVFGHVLGDAEDEHDVPVGELRADVGGVQFDKVPIAGDAGLAIGGLEMDITGVCREQRGQEIELLGHEALWGRGWSGRREQSPKPTPLSRSAT